MSFFDLEAGLSKGPSAPNGASQSLLNSPDPAYSELISRIQTRVLTSNSNNARIQRLIQRLGTHTDSEKNHDELHALLEETHKLVCDTMADIKQLGSFPGKTPQEMMEQQKLSRDYQMVIDKFKGAQQFAAERLQTLKVRVEAQQKQNANIRLQKVMENEVTFNESMIQQRDAEIIEIEQGITQLNEIFRDLGTIVTEQQTLLDNIEHNVDSVAVSTQRGAEELTTANRYQRRGRQLKCYLLLVLSIILAFVILLVFMV
ncbi:t-SNARE [Syncephalis fuscata]|nr:t-SNARE [Syncephalis fuscata]